MTQLVFTDRRGSDSEKWAKYAGSDVIPAWVADSDFLAAEPIIKALQARVAHGVFGYCQPARSLKETFCRYFEQRWGWQVNPDWIVFSPGLGTAIHNSCRMARGGGILTPQPIYHVFRQAPRTAGARRVDMPMRYDGDRWRLPMESMQAAAAETPPRPKIFQLSNPHNPNGKVYTRDELLEIGEFCCRHDLLIFSDEVHADLLMDSDARHIPIASLSPEIAARAVTMQSPSKAYNIAGLNFACVIIRNKRLRYHYQEAARGRVLGHLNPFGVIAAETAYSGECEAWRQAMITQLRANRDALRQAVEETDGITMPHLEATYLAWLNVKALNLPDAPAHFIRHGVGMSPGEDFGDKDYMRLNFACSPELLQEIIARIKTAVKAA